MFVFLMKSYIYTYRSAYCDAQLPPENLREYLPRLIPVSVVICISFINI